MKLDLNTYQDAIKAIDREMDAMIFELAGTAPCAAFRSGNARSPFAKRLKHLQDGREIVIALMLAWYDSDAVPPQALKSPPSELLEAMRKQNEVLEKILALQREGIGHLRLLSNP